MSAKWLRLESDIVDHPKTGRLEALLNEPLAGWYVIRALSWMSRFCPTGHVRDNDGTSLESSAKWRGTSGELLAALVSCGWLDVVPGGWEWHDWGEHQGKVAHKAAKERERKAAYRARAVQNVPRDNDGTSAGRPAQRDVTGRDVTGRDVETTAPLLESLVPPEPFKPKAPKRAAEPPRDSDLLVYDFKLVTGSDYRWNGAKDGVALADLLKTSTLDEVRARWRRGLEAPANAWASCRTVAQLRQKWNDLLPATVAGPPKSTRDDTGPIRAIVHTRWPTS